MPKEKRLPLQPCEVIAKERKMKRLKEEKEEPKNGKEERAKKITGLKFSGNIATDTSFLFFSPFFFTKMTRELMHSSLCFFFLPFFSFDRSSPWLLFYSSLFSFPSLYSFFSCVCSFVFCCIGGNQRELNRAKNAKKQAEMGKGNKDDTPANLRKERQVLMLSLRSCCTFICFLILDRFLSS